MNEYIYGMTNGHAYTLDGSDGTPRTKTHWDPRLSIREAVGVVEIGITPPSDKSTDDQGLWDNADGQFMTISRDGLNRLIRAAREARDAAYGRDE